MDDFENMAVTEDVRFMEVLEDKEDIEEMKKVE